MKPVTSTPNIQNEAISNAVKIEKIKGILSCIFSGAYRRCTGCDNSLNCDNGHIINKLNIYQ